MGEIPLLMEPCPAYYTDIIMLVWLVGFDLKVND